MMQNRRIRRMAALLAAAVMMISMTGFAAADEAAPGELRLAISRDITTMDVSKTTDDYMIPMNVFDRLFETRPGENGAPAEVVKSLCSDYSVSADGLTYDFTLLDGVVFSNGSALTASDVQFSFERLLKIGNQNTDIPMEVAGSDAVMAKEAETLSGFTVKDDTHFSITLKTPNAGFPAELSSPAMSIADRETMTDGFGTEPAETIGSGPYIVTEWVSNDHYTLEYNPKYRGEAPSVKKVTAKVIPDANTQNLMFQNGELDLIDLRNQDGAVIQSIYKTMYADRMVSVPNVGMIFMILNEKQEYLQNVKVRKAIAMAIDRDTIIATLYNGDAKKENGIIPTGVWAHNNDLEGFNYDPEGAKALLQEAGYAPGQVQFEMSMDSTAAGTLQLVYQAISQMLEEAGINATVKTYDHAAWLEKRGSGAMDSFLGRWGMDYNDPANIMYTFFGTVDNSTHRSVNYPDTDVIARVAAASAIVDDAERMAEYQALEKKLIQEDAAWVSLLEDMHLYCRGERVKEFVPQWAGFTDLYVTDVTMNE